ncbi:MAG: hypothetical protein ACRDQX_01895 [Pseudonocardiaceae bacterium]
MTSVLAWDSSSVSASCRHCPRRCLIARASSFALGGELLRYQLAVPPAAVPRLEVRETQGMVQVFAPPGPVALPESLSAVTPASGGSHRGKGFDSMTTPRTSAALQAEIAAITAMMMAQERGPGPRQSRRNTCELRLCPAAQRASW